MRHKFTHLLLLLSLVSFSFITCSSATGSSWRRGGAQGGAGMQSLITSLQQSKEPEANQLARKIRFMSMELRKDGKQLGPLQPYLNEMQRSAQARNYDAAERALWDAVGEAYNASFWKQVSFTSSDGFKVYGYLTETKGKGRFPIIVLVHGGEHGSASIYQRHAFLFLKRNLATLAVDYRGSSGHGESYKNAADPAGKEIDDVVKAVEYAKNLPTTTGVGLMGSSHGAFISGNVLTRTSDVRVAALNFGGYNFETLLEQWEKAGTQVAQRKTEVWGTVVQEQGTDAARAVSPIYNVDKINAPVLLIHGKNDKTVPYAESVNMYEEMKKHNKTVSLKLFTDGPHGFIFKPDEESDSAFETTDEFLEKYLK